jgi:hypothetical protein
LTPRRRSRAIRANPRLSRIKMTAATTSTKTPRRLAVREATKLWVLATMRTSCDLLICMDQAADAVAS